MRLGSDKLPDGLFDGRDMSGPDTVDDIFLKIIPPERVFVFGAPL